MAESAIKVTPATTEQVAGYKFSAKQNLAIELFARGFTYREISAQVGVTTPTLTAWMKLPGFSESIDFYRQSVVSKRLKELDSKMGQYESEAVEFLASTMRDSEQKISDRLNAARMILAHQNSRKQMADNQVMVSFGGMPVIGKAEGNILTGEVSGK